MARALLVVDDIRSNRSILKHMLGGEYEVFEASNGEEALQFLLEQHERISAVLLDISMPKLNGYEVLRKMRSNALLAALPVIMITGSENEEARIKALTYGANDFVMKPYSSEILRHCLHNNIAFHEAKATLDVLRRDSVTGLYNREAFFEQVQCAVFRHKPGYYVMTRFDIDKFKVINDQYGTEKGDEVLRHVAETLRRGFEPHGGLCCRISADNFSVLYPASFQDSDEIVAIRQTAAQIEGLIFPIVFTIGRYVVDDISLSPAAMYDRAALAAGTVKGRYDKKIAQYDEAMREQMIYEQRIVTEMAFALESRQFEVWFQPQYNHATDALIGAEALVRWRHPDIGLIPPDKFIPIFERNGFTYELDQFVWEEVCRCLRKWTDEGRTPLPVSVNISRYDMYQENMVETMCSLIQKYDLSVEMLRLEITESAFAEASQRVVGVVNALIECGFTVEIDDFGSGYSSLNTLKDVPAQILKLDMRFFENSDNSQRGGNIVESVIRMAKWLGMSVISEGVETLAQANFLRSIGCNYIQGYLYAKPMPSAQYEAHCSGSEREEKLIALETVEHLDNNAFWDANSVDTLIFNSYVGAACIFEYYNGKVELIRATDKYAQVFGGAGMSVEDVLRINWSDHLDRDSYRHMSEALEESARTKGEVTGEFLFLDLPGCPHETYVRSTMRIIATAADRYLVYCTNENMTAQRQSEQRERELSEQLQAIMENIDSGVSAFVLRDGIPCPVFANDTYFKLVGYTRAEYRERGLSLLDCIVPGDMDRVMECCAAVGTTGQPGSVEFHIKRKDGAVRLLKSNVTMMKYPGIDEQVQLSVSNDITEQRETERESLRLSEQIQAIMDNADVGIIAAVYEGDSAQCLFANNRYYDMLGCTRETFSVQYDSLDQTVAPEDRQRMTTEINRLNCTGGLAVLEYRPNRADAAERVFRAMVSVGKLSGVHGPVQLSILRDVTEDKALARREQETAQQLQTMMDDIPGGFVRMRLDSDGSIRPVYFNKGFFSLVGMDYDELMAIYAGDALAGVHPDDVTIVNRAVSELVERGEARSARYRLKHGNGDYIWLMFFGRVTKGKKGQTFLNIYYSDATKEARAEEQSRELLDNLPCGAALYAVENHVLSAVYLNKRYWELVGRRETDYKDDAFLSAVCPEDRAIISFELELGIKECRDVSCDVHILCGDNTYRPFHVAGHILKKSDTQHAVYAVYTPITNTALSVQQMLPLALSAVMDVQKDYSFVKDRSMRYICCSRSVVELAGYDSPSEFIGRDDRELFGESLAEEFGAGDRHIMETGEAVVDELVQFIAEDGLRRYISTSKYPLKDTEGNIIGLYGIGYDTTENRTIKSQYEWLTNSIPGGVATYEVQDGSLRITFFSDGFCRLFKLTREEYEAVSANDVFAGVFKEDLAALKAQIDTLIHSGKQADCTYRIFLRGGGYKWINLKASRVEQEEGKSVFHAVAFDVTQRQEMLEQLRVSEEENRLAMEHTSNTVCRYDVESRTVRIAQRAQNKFQLPELVEDLPLGPVKSGLISPATAQAYCAFFDGIHSGKKTGTARYQRLFERGWRWLEGHHSTIFNGDGKPVSAVISFADVTDQLEKENAYKRWQQSYLSRPQDSYSLFRCNVKKETSIDTRNGDLLRIPVRSGTFMFDDYTAEYVQAYVVEEDGEKVGAFLNVDALLSNFYQGKRILSLEYREKVEAGEYRWLRLTVDLVEHANQAEIEAYLLFEDIDEARRRELETMMRAQNDPLTGVLNRTTFAAQVDKKLRDTGRGALGALLMLDMDGFKRVNDSFGHSAGDQTLIDIAESLRKVLRHDDLIGRLGGDEYLVFLANIPDGQAAAEKARQICEVTRRSFGGKVDISGSIGIAIAPKDGIDYETLYRKADKALYRVKGSGKDNYAFYCEDKSQ